MGGEKGRRRQTPRHQDVSGGVTGLKQALAAGVSALAADNDALFKELS